MMASARRCTVAALAVALALAGCGALVAGSASPSGSGSGAGASGVSGRTATPPLGRGGFWTRPQRLWPMPETATPLAVGTPLTLGTGATLAWAQVGLTVGSAPYTLLERAFVRYSHDLFNAEPALLGDDAVVLSSPSEKSATHGRVGGGSSSPLQPGAKPQDIDGVRVHVADKGASGSVIQLGVDESYAVYVNSSSKWISIEAQTVWGALRGLETMSQLTYGGPGSGDGSGDYLVQQYAITDKPRFSWRGILVDTSRHFLPVEYIKNIIASMPFNKMNTFHWHVVDGQSFPLVSLMPGTNKLSQGAYAPDLVYSPSDVEELVEFANDRGVRIVPEFDMPAHATSWGVGYPELIMRCQRFADECQPQPYAKRKWDDGCADDPFNPIRPQTYSFLSEFLGEMAARFPDKYVHLGGDELSYREQCWNTTAILAFMKENGLKTFLELEGYFIHKVQAISDKNDKDVLHWQEIFNNGIKMPVDKVIVHIWKDHPTLDAVVNAGYRGILSFGWYLDHLSTTWEDMWKNEPIDNTLGPQAAARVLGGEACMWAESVDYTNIESRIWPRASAVAERLWSPKSLTNATDAYMRLHDQRCRQLARGRLAEPLFDHPGWCY